MRTLLLTADHIPMKAISVKKAIHGIYAGDYYSVKDDPMEVYRSPSTSIPVPLAVAPFRHVALPAHHFAQATLNNTNLFLRDNYVCSFCNESFDDTPSLLTRDHVLARSNGGANSWSNCVTACQVCNNIKGNTLHKIGPNGEMYWDVVDPYTGDPKRMVLDFIPKAPTKLVMTHMKEVRRGILDPTTLYR